MARVALNDLLEGLQGKMGNALVFKNIRGKTFVSLPARKPNKKKETEAQRQTRNNFRKATHWAQGMMLDPQKKAYYQERAKALNLPNAYTAAITDYMRKVKADQSQFRDTIRHKVKKRGFSVKEVKVSHVETNELMRDVVIKKYKDEWHIEYKVGTIETTSLRITAVDNFNRITIFSGIDFETG